MKGWRSRLVVALLGCCLTAPLGAWGLTAHQEICERGRALINPLLYRELYNLLHLFPDSADSGSAHPDAYWALAYLYPDRYFLFRAAGELAHGRDGLFLDNFVAVMREQAEPPFTPQEQQEIAFFLGNFAHQAGDATFHPNFLQEGMAQDGTTETWIEVGCDIFCQWEGGERWEEIEWFVPLPLIVEVFARCGLEVAAEDIETGMSVLKLASDLERRTGLPIYFFFISRLHWVHANYFDYPEGGINDGAAESATGMELLWEDLIGDNLLITPGLLPELAPRVGEELRNPFLRWALELWLSGRATVPIRRNPEGSITLGSAIGCPAGAAEKEGGKGSR